MHSALFDTACIFFLASSATFALGGAVWTLHLCLRNHYRLPLSMYHLERVRHDEGVVLKSGIAVNLLGWILQMFAYAIFGHHGG